jgi:hypothetical protein
MAKKQTREQEAVERCAKRVAAAAKKYKDARQHLMAAVAACENAAIDQVLEIERWERAREKAGI